MKKKLDTPTASTATSIPTGLVVNKGTEARIMRWALVAGISAAVISWVAYMLTGTWSIPITGSLSLARPTIILSFIFGTIGFGRLFWELQSNQFQAGERDVSKLWVRWRDAITLSLVYGVTFTAILGIFAYGIGQSFQGLLLDPYISTVLVGLSVGVFMYLILSGAAEINTNTLIMMLSFVLIGGVFLSMLTQSSPDWWQSNFSYLGTGDSNRASALAFNLTLIFGGLMMLALTEYVFTGLQHAIKDDDRLMKETKVNTVKIAFVLMAIALMGVGVFPYEANTIYARLHNTSATLLVIIFLGLIAFLKRLVPSLSREFFIISYVVSAILLFCFYLTSVGYFNTTAFELSAFGLCFVWLFLFLKNVNLIGQEER
ncbi:MAG: hypothetical protein WCI47_02385 [bacterium]